MVEGPQGEIDMTDTATDDTTRIAQLNDDYRQTGPSAGNWHITAGVQDLGPVFVGAAIQMVRTFDAFTPDNDPYGQHDFGSFTGWDHKLFWKIDYYGLTLDYGSEDPADPTITTRVMTIMLASEY
jgi:hypothetical protein